jgi:cell division protein ZapA
MADLDVTVAGRNYRLACDDGQEAHLLSLAAMLDREARALSAGGGVIGEARVLLMTALMMADRLHEAQAALKSASGAGATASGDEAAALDGALGRLEALVVAQESAGHA